MHKKIIEFRSQYHELILKELYPAYDRSIKKELSEFVTLENKIQEVYQKPAISFEELLNTKESILLLTEEIWNTYEPDNFSSFAEAYIINLEAEINKLPTRLKIPQNEARFHKQTEDSALLGLAKSLKRFCWTISQLPKRILKKKSTYWKHVVPVQHIAYEYLVNEISHRLKPMLSDHYISLMKAYIDLKEWESAQKVLGSKMEVINRFETLKKETSAIKRSLKKQILATSEECWDDMEHAMECVGTIEMSPSRFNQDRIEKRRTSLDKRWIRDEEGWINTFDLFLESWRSDLTLQSLMLKVQSDLKTYVDSQSKNIHEYVGEELNGVESFISESIHLVDKAGDELPSVLKKRIYQTQKTLDQTIIPSLLEKLSNKNLINGIARLESSTLHELEDLTTERRTPKVQTDYLEPLLKDEITTISPYDLIAFEIAPDLSEKFDSIKAELIGKLNENLLIAQDMDHMISYGLTASLDEYQSNADLHTASDVALESLKRSASRVKDVRDSLEQCIQVANEKITHAVEDYVDSLEDLTKTENVREIRLRIMRAKAMQSAEEYKDEMREKFIKRYQDAVHFIKDKFSIFVQLKNKLTRQLALSTEEDVAIEVANFLVDSENVIESLPLIYRNLYRISPITDQELYVGREKELSELTDAYNHWVDNKKGAVVIVGEKWSGLTSFINHLQHSNYFNYSCNRFITKTSINNKEALFGFFSDLLDEPLDADTSWSAIAERFNKGARKIVIIEDIQCLYLRKVGGFDNLMGLSELIQSTSYHVLWIVTCNLYSWQYFQRTLQLDEAFRFLIELKTPTKDEIEELIQKRNRISGYKLYFKPPEASEQSKKFTKLSEMDQQQILKEKFFKNLIEYSASNISMALMFWLLSTEQVTEDRIEIGEFKRPDLSFLSAMSLEKVTSLHLLILHDGLTVDQFSELARMQTQSSKLLLASMYEDGILLKKGEYLMVNPLIYRSVISMLTTKNLL